MHLLRTSGDVGFETVFLQISPGDSDEDQPSLVTTELYKTFQ